MPSGRKRRHRMGTHYDPEKVVARNRRWSFSKTRRAVPKTRNERSSRGETNSNDPKDKVERRTISEVENPRTRGRTATAGDAPVRQNHRWTRARNHETSTRARWDSLVLPLPFTASRRAHSR